MKRPLPITLLPFLPPNSASRSSRSLEVGQRGGVGGAGPEATAESGLESQLPLFLPGSKEATTMLHMLTLLKDLLPCFPEGLVKSCSETLLRVMTLNHVVSSCPSAWGCAEEEGAELQTPGLCAGTREAHCSGQKRELGPPGPDPALGYTQGRISSLGWGRLAASAGR